MAMSVYTGQASYHSSKSHFDFVKKQSNGNRKQTLRFHVRSSKLLAGARPSVDQAHRLAHAFEADFVRCVEQRGERISMLGVRDRQKGEYSST